MRMIAIAAALLANSIAAPSAQTAQDPHAQMNHRGAAVMGFDQQTTAHQFLLYNDGGAIDVGVKDPANAADRDAIRGHLPHIAMMFSQGDFSAPMLIHATDVPGTAELKRLKDRVTYRYVETPAGGRVDISSSDRAALTAMHAFLRFQITDHRTGDSLEIRQR